MSLKDLQSKIGTTADGVFGKNTFNLAMNHFKLSPLRAIHFFAQTSHETGGFKVFTENLNYSADGLVKVFPKYFPTLDLANAYERKPEKIANIIYSNRMGNGNQQSGEGYKFRGRGALQLTGKDNYTAFATYLKNNDILNNPDLVATIYSFESAMFFFERNKLWSICDKGVSDEVIKELTKRINGGYNGIDDRIAKTKLYYSYIQVV